MKKTSLRDIDKFFNGKKILLIAGALLILGSITDEPTTETEHNETSTIQEENEKIDDVAPEIEVVEEITTETIEEVEENPIQKMEKELSKIADNKTTIKFDNSYTASIKVEMENFSCLTSTYMIKVYDILEYIQKNPIDGATDLIIGFWVDGSEFLDVYGNPCTVPQLMSSAWIEVETLEKINFENITCYRLYEREELLSYYFDDLVDDDYWN